MEVTKPQTFLEKKIQCAYGEIHRNVSYLKKKYNNLLMVLNKNYLNIKLNRVLVCFKAFKFEQKQ